LPLSDATSRGNPTIWAPGHLPLFFLLTLHSSRNVRDWLSQYFESKRFQWDFKANVTAGNLDCLGGFNLKSLIMTRVCLGTTAFVAIIAAVASLRSQNNVGSRTSGHFNRDFKLKMLGVEEAIQIMSLPLHHPNLIIDHGHNVLMDFSQLVADAAETPAAAAAAAGQEPQQWNGPLGFLQGNPGTSTRQMNVRDWKT
jgi:hypothetical protein